MQAHAQVWTVDGIVQGGALAILAMMAFYGLKWGIPAIVAQQRAVTDELREVSASNRVQSRVLAKLTAMLIQHDATVRGVNPDTVGTTQQLVDRILADSGDGQ